ncbi:MAG: methyltransferase domain-containing protein [Succinivibrionaceae bacterium]
MLKAPNPPKDQNFDNRAEFFKKQIYGTTKGKIRAAVVWRDLQEIINQFPKDKVLNVLDVGGGFGFMARKIAHLGHNVTVVDISEDMLSLGRLELTQDPVDGTLSFVQGAAQDIEAIFKDKKYDLVMCHAVLEWLIDPKPIIAKLKNMLAPSGVLSLLVYNKTALLFQSLVVGNFDYIKAGLVKRRRQKLTPQTPLYLEEVLQWINEQGLVLDKLSGVRVVHDYMRDKTDQINKFDDLLYYELLYSRHEVFSHLGRYIHIWTKPFNVI